MNRSSVRFLLTVVGCAVLAAEAAHPGFAQRPNPAPDPAPAAVAPAPSSEPSSPSATSSEPRRSKKAVSTRTPKVEKPRRPEKKKVAPARKPELSASSARSHEPDPGGTAASTVAPLPAAALIRSEPDAVPFSTTARLLLGGTILLTILLLAGAVAPRRLLARLSVDGLEERRADLAFAGLCVLTVGSLLGTLVAISG